MIELPQLWLPDRLRQRREDERLLRGRHGVSRRWMPGMPCGCGGACIGCEDGTAPDEMEVVLSSLRCWSFFGGYSTCDTCTGANGTYILPYAGCSIGTGDRHHDIWQDSFEDVAWWGDELFYVRVQIIWQELYERREVRVRFGHWDDAETPLVIDDGTGGGFTEHVILESSQESRFDCSGFSSLSVPYSSGTAYLNTLCRGDVNLSTVP